MFCYVARRRYSDFAASIEKAAIKNRLPYMGTLELTYRCNLSCCHCYCNLPIGDEKAREELTTSEVKKVIDELADAGCFWLLFTGGEILLRQDFSEIYIYAVKKGMLIEVFTNGTLIDEDIAKLFSEFPPIGIDISVYGSDILMHDDITGCKGSFNKLISGMGLLKKYDVRFSLKTIVMTLNCNDLDSIIKFSKKFTDEHKIDTVICPRLDGGDDPVNYRLSAEDMARLDLERDYKGCEWIFDNFWNKRYAGYLDCGAGLTTFNINPYGVLSPCTMFKSFQYDLKKDSFKNAWRRLAGDYEVNKKNFTPSECVSCGMVLICSRCPAASEIETGHPGKIAMYHCQYAKKLEEMYFIKKKEVKYAKETV